MESNLEKKVNVKEIKFSSKSSEYLLKSYSYPNSNEAKYDWFKINANGNEERLDNAFYLPIEIARKILSGAFEVELDKMKKDYTMSFEIGGKIFWKPNYGDTSVLSGKIHEIKLHKEYTQPEGEPTSTTTTTTKIPRKGMIGMIPKIKPNPQDSE